MIRSLWGFAVAMLLVAPAAAATSGGALMEPVNQFIGGFNKGDDKAVNASFVTTGLAIIDEVPPHVWTGPNALKAWVKDLAITDRKAGNTDQSVTVGAPTRAIADGTRGYLVVPAVYHYKMRGKALIERAQMTFALQKVSRKWLITGWTWVGTQPQPGK